MPGRGGVRIAVDPYGNPWIINDKKEIWKHQQETWFRIKGRASSIAIGAEGSVVVLGTRKTDGGYRIFKWSHQTELWQFIGLGAVEVAVGPRGKVYYIDAQGKMYWPDEDCPETIDPVA